MQTNLLGFGLVFLSLTAACSSSEPNAQGDGGALADTGAPGDTGTKTNPPPCADAGEPGARGSYVCGTCDTDAIDVPICANSVLTCAPGVSLVNCGCGILGLQNGCCDQPCGPRTGSMSCEASGKWECPAGKVACLSSFQCHDDAGSGDAAIDH